MGANRKKAGRKYEYDWSRVEFEACRLMNANGDFESSKPLWSAQSRLENALLVFCEGEFGREPSLAVLRRQVSAWLGRWRDQRRFAAE